MQFIGSGFGIDQIDQAVAGQPDDNVARLIYCGVGYVFKFYGKRVAKNLDDPCKRYVVLALDLYCFLLVPRKFHLPVIHTHAY